MLNYVVFLFFLFLLFEKIANNSKIHTYSWFFKNSPNKLHYTRMLNNYDAFLELAYDFFLGYLLTIFCRTLGKGHRPSFNNPNTFNLSFFPREHSSMRTLKYLSLGEGNTHTRDKRLEIQNFGQSSKLLLWKKIVEHKMHAILKKNMHDSRA